MLNFLKQPVVNTLQPQHDKYYDFSITLLMTHRLRWFKVMNRSEIAYPVRIQISVIEAFSYSTVAIVLTSKNLNVENSLDEPTRLAPVEHRLPSIESIILP